MDDIPPGCVLTFAAQARKSPVVNARTRRSTFVESFGIEGDRRRVQSFAYARDASAGGE